MYSGITLRNASGNIIGAHQKIDRVARRQLSKDMPAGITFPSAREILVFEGKDGPDGIKRKSPARDEPWHYIDPSDPEGTELLKLIKDHMTNLTMALAGDDNVRSAFEAAWLAHAVVDGLTPAHHYPLEEKLQELRGGESLETRTTLRKKVVMPGSSVKERLKNNWEFWGAKGVMTTHGLFEIGISTSITTHTFTGARPSANERVRAVDEGFEVMFLEALARIHRLKMYETFHTKGWTRKLARQTRQELMPEIIRAVVLAWFVAATVAAKKKVQT